MIAGAVELHLLIYDLSYVLDQIERKINSIIKVSKAKKDLTVDKAGNVMLSVRKVD